MKIGLVPMSAKPYHLGHHFLVTTAASENDKVLLFVSISDRCRPGEVPIYGGDMQKIWCDQLETIIPANVQVFYGGSPIRKVFDVLVAEEERLISGNSIDNFYKVYSDEEDTRQNYTVGRSKKPGAQSPVDRYFPGLYSQGFVKFAAEENPEIFTRGAGAPDISGTSMRNMLISPESKESFKANLPADLSDEDREAIYTTLRSRLEETKYFKDRMIDEAIRESFSGRSKKRPEKGTQEYTDYLDEIMGELQHIKSSYESRKKTGARYRKEAAKIQDAYSELRRLKRKNQKILDAQKLNELYNCSGYNYNVSVSAEERLNLDDIRSFLNKFKL